MPDRPANVPDHFVERPCANPVCNRTTWIPPAEEQAAKDAGVPVASVCSAACVKAVTELMGGQPAGLVDFGSPSLGYKIERLLAYVAEDEDGEGIMAAPIPGIGNMPLVGADMDRMMSYRPFAQRMAKASGRKVKLVRFDQRTVVEEL